MNSKVELVTSVGARSEVAPEVQDEASDVIACKAVHVVGDILLRHCDGQNPRDDCGTVRGDCRRPAKHRTGLLRLSDRRHLTCKKKAPVMHKEDRRGVQSLEGVERGFASSRMRSKGEVVFDVRGLARAWGQTDTSPAEASRGVFV